MIDQEVFAQQMALLADRIGRALAGPTLRAYYDELSSDLTTAEFVAATQLAFSTWQDWRWPSPTEIRRLVKPTDPTNLRAVELFEDIAYIASNVYQDDRARRIERHGPVAARAFRAIGGLDAFRDLDVKERPWLKKRFIEAYEQASDSAVAQEHATVALRDADIRVQRLVVGLSRSLTSGHDKGSGTS